MPPALRYPAPRCACYERNLETDHTQQKHGVGVKQELNHLGCILVLKGTATVCPSTNASIPNQFCFRMCEMADLPEYIPMERAFRALNIEFFRKLRILLDELEARFGLVAHQRRYR